MKKRLSMLISLGLVALISVGVIVMFLIQVNYKPQINEPNSIVVNDGSTFTKTGNATYFNEIIAQYEKSFTRSYLSAFFAGQVSGNTSVYELSNTDFNNLSFSEYKIEFYYSSAQTLQENGQNLLRTYDKIIFSVNDNAIYKEIKLYFKQMNETNYYVVTTYAIQNNFFDYLENLFE
ncbi:MAG: hypothetical protein PHQ62_03740 [Clostridia bacterium]|nr:hypothetical protein [Clostridia bacterium]